MASVRLESAYKALYLKSSYKLKVQYLTMSFPNNTSMLPNPFTPLAFLPPEMAYQATVVNLRYRGHSRSENLLSVLTNILSNQIIFAIGAYMGYSR